MNCNTTHYRANSSSVPGDPTGRPEVIRARVKELGLHIDLEQGVRIIDPHGNPELEAHSKRYHGLVGGKGLSPGDARKTVQAESSVLGALLLDAGEVDALLCGTTGDFNAHLRHVGDVIGMGRDVHEFSTVTALVLPSGTFFVCDTHVTPDPSARAIAEMALLAAGVVWRFGIKPRVALLSHSHFGSHDDASARKMREALKILQELQPGLEVEGEMRADAAVSEEIRRQAFPGSKLRGPANLLVMPNVDAANVSANLLKMLGGGVTVGPMLVGAAKPAHIVTTAMTVRGLVNMTALVVVEAQTHVA